MPTTKKPRVLIVHDFLSFIGGAERNLLNFLRAYPQADICFSYIIDNPVVDQFLKKIKLKYPHIKIHTTFIQNLPALKYLFRFYKFFIPLAFEAFDVSAYNLIICQTSRLTKGIITTERQKSVVYVNTPDRWLWNFPGARKRLLRYIPTPIVLLLKTYLLFWDSLAMRRADLIIANSHAVKARIKQNYQLDSSVIWPAISLSSVDLTLSILTDLKLQSHKYIVMINRLDKYKETDKAIKAFSKGLLVKRKLVIIGNGPELINLINQAKNLTKQRASFKVRNGGWQTTIVQNIIFVEQANDQVANTIRHSALALLNINEEDFGLGMAESLVLGIPIIAVNYGGACDIVLSKKNGLFIRSSSTKKIYNAIKQLQKLQASGQITPQAIKKSAKRFSRQKFVQKLHSSINALYMTENTTELFGINL